MTTVHRLDLGYFVRPAAETGTGAPRVEPCLGYLVRHEQATLLFDTGMGHDAEVEAYYDIRRSALPAALAACGATLADIDLISNCHLHFDHCGGNALFANVPILTQATELATARATADYTLPELVAGTLRYEELSGEAEVLPGIWLIPTPGHTAGHQSLVVQQPDGSIVLAGQSHPSSAEFSAEVLARRAHSDGGHSQLPPLPRWLDRLLEFDPSRVVFAHDHSIWQG